MLQDGLFDHSPLKIPVEKEIVEMKIKKVNTQGSKEKSFEKLVLILK